MGFDALGETLRGSLVYRVLDKRVLFLHVVLEEVLFRVALLFFPLIDHRDIAYRRPDVLYKPIILNNLVEQRVNYDGHLKCLKKG